MSSSSDGDDLPGLLVNWAVGLTTASKCVEVREKAGHNMSIFMTF